MEPKDNAVEPCGEHHSCVRGYKRFDVIGQPGTAGWWHFEWSDVERTWRLSDPSGSERMVPANVGRHPVEALVGAVQGVVLAEIAWGILREELFPP
jgi:hypothetical protein